MTLKMTWVSTGPAQPGCVKRALRMKWSIEEMSEPAIVPCRDDQRMESTPVMVRKREAAALETGA